MWFDHRVTAVAVIDEQCAMLIAANVPSQPPSAPKIWRRIFGKAERAELKASAAAAVAAALGQHPGPSSLFGPDTGRHRCK